MAVLFLFLYVSNLLLGVLVRYGMTATKVQKRKMTKVVSTESIAFE